MNAFDVMAKGLALYVQDCAKYGTPFDELNAIADKCVVHFVLCITKDGNNVSFATDDGEALEARFVALPSASQCQFKFKVLAV